MKPKLSEVEVAYSYLRFSSSAQRDGDSVKRQTRLRESWLARNPRVRLDTSLEFLDDGVSGYDGTNRLDPRKAMAAFVAHVESGRVKAGSYLIVENLDRLTREHPTESIPAVLRLIKLGIKIVQLEPSEVVYHADMGEGPLFLMLMELQRGHGESKRKSGLLKSAWGEKKGKARDGVPLGRTCPGWIELTEDGYKLRPGPAKTVRQIYRWAAGGIGVTSITEKLRQERVPPFGHRPGWSRAYVALILRTRAVLGEYQPKKGTKRREVDGEAVEGYYPPCVTPAEFYAARKAMQLRKNYSGRPAGTSKQEYCLSGLLHCASDGGKVYVQTRRREAKLVSARAREGHTDRCPASFPLRPFTEAVLSCLKELSAAELFNDQGGALVSELTAELEEVNRKLRVARERFDRDPESPTWADMVDQYDQEKRRLSEEVEAARQAAETPLSASWADALAAMKSNEPERLRQCLLATVAEVWCVFVERGRDRLAAVQVFFAGNRATRGYVIWAKAPPIGSPYPKHYEWKATSWAALELADVDLRKRKDALAMARQLESLAFSRL